MGVGERKKRVKIMAKGEEFQEIIEKGYDGSLSKKTINFFLKARGLMTNE